jgi:hypothetical protein
MPYKLQTAKLIYMRIIFAIILVVFTFGETTQASAEARLQAGATRYVATSGTDSGDCTSSASPCRSIQYAVNQAATGDQILVASGTYTYNASHDQCTFLVTRAVVCVANKSLTISGGYTTSNWSTANPSVNVTRIDGQNARRGVVVIRSIANTHLTMQGFTIENGRAQGPLYPNISGGRAGGMWVSRGSVTLQDIIFRNNRAIGDNTASGAGGAADGAALTIESSPGANLLQRVTFDSNQSTGGSGPERGGVAFGALFIYASTVTVEDSTFTNNLAQAGNSSGNGESGGLHADALGGAIGIERAAVTLNRIVATNNEAIGGNAATNAGGAFGGAIFVEDAASFVLRDSYIFNNSTQGGNAATGGFSGGGGILVFNSPAIIEQVEVISNHVVSGNATGPGNAGPAGGGGLYLWRTRTDINPAISVTNVIVADNSVNLGNGAHNLGGGGGGITIQGLTANIAHATFARNQLGPNLISGQALLVLAAPGVSASTANISYSIVADHMQGASDARAVFAQQGNTVNFNRGLFAGNDKNTNVDHGNGGTFNGLASMLSAASASFVSPGSPDFDYRIRSNSAARDQATGSTIAIDIDRQGRPFGGVSDLGADEYSTQPLPTFVDVPGSYWAFEWIERLYAAGITGGCSTAPSLYCPTTVVTRDQMAVFLLKGMHGSAYTPPGVGGSTGFADVPTTHWAAAWIKRLAAEGITGGCGSGTYCPFDAVTRDQMAVFLLKSKYGPGYTPPAVGGSTGFTDVPPTHWAAAWIKQLAAEGITGGCSATAYCPGSPVTRDQMAVFLVRTFGLP